MSYLMLHEEAQVVREAMRKYGGSFMRQIGDAMDYADMRNLAKIRQTWLKEWNEYLVLAGREDLIHE